MGHHHAEEIEEDEMMNESANLSKKLNDTTGKAAATGTALRISP